MASRKTLRRRHARRLARAHEKEAETALVQAMAATGHALIASALTATWPGASREAIYHGRHLVLARMREATRAGHEMCWQRATKSVTRAACTAIASRPLCERDLAKVLRRMRIAVIRENAQ